MKHHLAVGLIAFTAFSAAAIAQTTTPTPTVQFATVPSDAALSYNLIGLNVYNGAEENVGEIKDIVIASNKLDGYILSVGGFLGVGNRYVVVRPDSVSINYEPAKGKWMAMINATKEQLKVAPEFKYEGRWKAS
jgi:hypothetical protein